MIRNATVKLKKGESGQYCTKENTGHLFVADSVGEFAAAAVSNERSNPTPFKSDYFSRSWIGWTGDEFRSIEDARDAAGKIWDKGMKMAEQLLSELQGEAMPVPTSRRRKRRWNEDSGDDICYDRLRSGQQFWRETYRTKTKSPATITVICNTAASAGTQWQSAMWRPLTAVCLVYLLEKAGCRVRLYSAHTQSSLYDNKDAGCFAMLVKDHSQTLNIGAAITGASTWFYRTLGFAASNLRHGVGISSGQGYPGKLDAFARTISSDKNTLIVDSVFDKAAAVGFIKRSVAAVEAGDLTVLPWTAPPLDLAS